MAARWTSSASSWMSRRGSVSQRAQLITRAPPQAPRVSIGRPDDRSNGTPRLARSALRTPNQVCGQETQVLVLRPAGRIRGEYAQAISAHDCARRQQRHGGWPLDPGAPRRSWCRTTRNSSRMGRPDRSRTTVASSSRRMTEYRRARSTIGHPGRLDPLACAGFTPVPRWEFLDGTPGQARCRARHG